MKVFTNTELIENRSKWAKRVAPFTMIFLIGGLITNFLSINNPDLFRPTLILLALGFFSAIISSNLVNNWVKEPRADQVLAQMLKKFGNDYLLFNYTSNVPHALVAPNGIYTFVVKSHDGTITVDGRRVSRKFNWKRIFKLMADEGMGSPLGEAENRAKKLRKQLSATLAEDELPQIKPLVLFSNKDVQLSVNNPDIPVLQTNELKLFLREEGKDRLISADQRKTLIEILGG